jgi:hypothetical protein
MNEAAPAPAPFSSPYEAAGPRLGFGIGPDGTYTRSGQILAFLAGLWAMVVFFPALVAGALLYTKSEEIFTQDPVRARTLVLRSWLSITVVPPILLVLTLLVVGTVRNVFF